jgi:hypothetical protein
VPAAAIPPAHVGLGWLAAVVPSAARRFRVVDPELDAALRYAGADLVEERADVEIAPPEEMRAEAPLAAFAIAETDPEDEARAVRLPLRVARSIRVRRRAAAAARSLRARGYGDVSTVFWVLDQPLPLGAATAPPRAPLWALVVGRREPPSPTILDRAAADADAGPIERALVRQGVLVALAERGVLRVALGSAERQLAEQRSALEALAQLAPSDAVTRLLPRPLAAGQAGVARWALERRLPGTRAGRVTTSLRSDCFELLVELHGLGKGSTQGAGGSRNASTVASFCSAEETELLGRIGSRLDAALSGLAPGFAHGDFWLENLLAEDGRLTGVVDWEYAGAGRLPLLDLFHLLVNEQGMVRRSNVGKTIVGWLLPTVRSGGDETIRDFCRRIDLEPEARVLTDLAVAYWLDYISHQLELYADRSARPIWMRDNVSAVLRAVG